MGAVIVKCPCCKGTGTLDDKVGVKLSPMQQRIYELLCRASINASSHIAPSSFWCTSITKMAK